jgi:hypothetical protein
MCIYLSAILVFFYFGCSSTKRDDIEKMKKFIKPIQLGLDMILDIQKENQNQILMNLSK